MSTPIEVEDRAATQAKGARAKKPAASASTRTTIQRLAPYGLVLGFVVMVVIFSSLRPDTFPTWANLQTTLTLAAAPLVMAVTLTVVLVMGDFDLSFGGMIGLAGATAVVLTSHQDLLWPAAIAVTLGVGILAGLLNGYLIAYVGLSSFIVTLAMGTVLLGTEYLITDQRTIFENVPLGYQAIASRELLGVGYQIWIAAIIALIVYLVLHQTELGRYMYAIGGNYEASRLAGVPTSRLRLVGFVIVAVGAVVAGVLLTSQAAASTPNIGASMLLPAFAAVFLGTAVFRLGQFNIPGTVVGVIFLSVLQTGLTMVDLSTAVVNIAQGAILVVAVAASRINPAKA